MDKSKLIFHLEDFILKKIDSLQAHIEDNRLSLADNTKSSVGDKHETSRAMAQLEQEKLGKQLQDQQHLLASLKQIDVSKSHDKIQFGSLFNLPQGWFFLSIGIGKIEFENQSIFCLTAGSPMGQQVLGKQEGDEILIAGKKNTIQSIF